MHESKNDDKPIFPGINFHNVQKNPNYIEKKLSKVLEEKKSMIPFPHSGHGCSRGRRKTMEDKHINLDNFKIRDLSISYYGVYDGHGGDEASILCSRILHVEFFKQIKENTEVNAKNAKDLIPEILRNTFLSVDKYMCGELTKISKDATGTTVAVVVIVERDIFIANLGDSEAVLGRRMKNGKCGAELLTKKHKPDDESEKKRIEQNGGYVFKGRVFGSLAVSRALGDGDFKPPKAEAVYVSSDPFVNHLTLEPDCEFIVIACDGLWDQVTYQASVDICSKALRNGYSSSMASRLLVSQSFEKNSTDNISVVVVWLNWKPRSSQIFSIPTTGSSVPTIVHKATKKLSSNKIVSKDFSTFLIKTQIVEVDDKPSLKSYKSEPHMSLEKENEAEIAFALIDYESDDPNHLKVKGGQKLIIKKKSKDMYMCESDGGNVGYVPKIHVSTPNLILSGSEN
eukprot:TRINITY_DN969_c0_g1_i2.p1 TRINITY_DN969_c0_g1~~TRINITY_DN969_c0_g1_i2.p1  ORF type:complete len:455 (-),score=74.87 TRINITY_DN969_c0_g1_i2:87-1451(-)